MDEIKTPETEPPTAPYTLAEIVPAVLDEIERAAAARLGEQYERAEEKRQQIEGVLSRQLRAYHSGNQKRIASANTALGGLMHYVHTGEKVPGRSRARR